MPDLSLEEQFKYHPPTTEERKLKHEIINYASLQFAKNPGFYDFFIQILRENVKDEQTLRMAIASANLAKLFIGHQQDSELSIEEIILAWWEQVRDIPKNELFLYLVQQARMFSNQGITIDDLNSANNSLNNKINMPNPIRATEGSHVLYVLPDGRNKGEIRPAIIVKVWRDVLPELIAQGYSNLVVFIDGTNDYPEAIGHTIWATSKCYSEDKEPGTWHSRLSLGAAAGAIRLGAIRQ